MKMKIVIAAHRNLMNIFGKDIIAISAVWCAMNTINAKIFQIKLKNFN